MGLELIIAAAALAAGTASFFVWRSLRVKDRKAEEAAPSLETKPAPISVVAHVSTKAPALLETRLGKTRSGLGRKLSDWFTSSSEKNGPSEWEALEEVLLEGDVGILTAQKLVEKVKGRVSSETSLALEQCFREEAESLLGGLSHGTVSLEGAPKPYVISVVGINGVGKTTTIGKLAQHFKNRGKTVLLGAGDTFRAGAIAQLKIWADRVGTEFVTGREGADPGAVAYDSIAAGQSRGIDVVLLDTAGRLHTKSNLMDELKKIHRVVKKVIPEAPHETWLVIDGTLGQNSLTQAKEFQKALELTGIIITKLDGTAKGGAVLAIASELKLPIRFIGIGEAVDDLVPFEPKPFVKALLAQ